MAQAGRPLSPHLQIYRWYFTMALSIVHRVTGVGLVLGMMLLTCWLVALAGGPESFATAQWLMHGFLGGLILFAFILTLFFHLLNGIRHLAWDAGWGFEKQQAHMTGLVVVGGAVGLSLLTWILVLALG